MGADLDIYAQYLHELVNRHRIEAGVQPLAWSEQLATAAREQARGMSATGVLTHAGQDGSTPVGRMRRAGYVFEGRWAGAENVAWKTASADDGRTWDVQQLDQRLITSDKHVKNRLDPRFRELGVGLHLGPMSYEPVALLTSEAYAVSGAAVFVTGVAFQDRNEDDAFQPGEAVAAVQVEARPITGGEPVRRLARAGGGYDLPLRPGRWTLVAYGPDGALAATVELTLSDANLKVDLVGAPSPDARTLGDLRGQTTGLAFRVRTRSKAAETVTATAAP